MSGAEIFLLHEVMQPKKVFLGLIIDHLMLQEPVAPFVLNNPGGSYYRPENDRTVRLC